MNLSIKKLSDNEFLLSENGRKIIILPSFKEAKLYQIQAALSELNHVS